MKKQKIKVGQLWYRKNGEDEEVTLLVTGREKRWWRIMWWCDGETDEENFRESDLLLYYTLISEAKDT